MSMTAEEVRERIRTASGGLTAEQVRARIAQAPGGAEIKPESPRRTLGERLRSGAAAVAEPIARTVEGFTELTGGSPEQMEVMGRARQDIEEEAAKSESRIAGNILGELGMMAYPASKAYGLTRTAAAARPFVSRAAPIAAESAAVGGIEAVKTPREGETRLGQALLAAGANLGGGAAQAAVRSMISPRMFRRTPLAQEEMAALRQAGITPDIPMSMGQPGKGTEGTGPMSKFARWMHRRPLAAIPPSQGIIRGQQDRALDDWRQMTLQRALPEGTPMPQVSPNSLRPVEETLDGINDWYSVRYKQVLDPFDFDVMTPNAPLGKAVNDVFNDIPGESVKRQVGQKLGDLIGNRATNGMISGSDVSALKTALRREAKLAQDGAEKKAYYDLIGAIDSGVETALKKIDPDIAKTYTSLRAPYRNFLTIDDAAGRKEFGEFEPKGLFQAGQRKAKSEKTNLRRAPLRQEAQRGMAVYETPSNTESNVFQLLALGGASVGGATASPLTAIPTAGAWLTSGVGLVPKGTRWMAGELPYQEALVRALRTPGMEELSRAARIGGGQYLAE